MRSTYLLQICLTLLVSTEPLHASGLALPPPHPHPSPPQAHPQLLNTERFYHSTLHMYQETVRAYRAFMC